MPDVIIIPGGEVGASGPVGGMPYMARNRREMSRKESRRDFRRKAIPHRKNVQSTAPMRGGYRL